MSREDNIDPIPADAPLISLTDAAAYMRMSVSALRKAIETDMTDLGMRLREYLVVLSPRRRYVKRVPFLAWLNGEQTQGQITESLEQPQQEAPAA